MNNSQQHDGRKEPQIDEATLKMIEELQVEFSVMPDECNHTKQWLTEEIIKLQRGERDRPKYIDVLTQKPTKFLEKITIPIQESPKVNFVGKLLGPKGMTLKKLQDNTGCRMAILGRGSMRDKSKEEEFRLSGDSKYVHLNDSLHVSVEAFAPAAEAYQRLSHAMNEIKKYLSPDFAEEIRVEQYQAMLEVDPNAAPKPGKPGYPGSYSGGPPPPRGRGAGPQRGGGMRGRGAPGQGRGGGMQMGRGGGGNGYAGSGRGAPMGRGEGYGSGGTEQAFTGGAGMGAGRSGYSGQAQAQARGYESYAEPRSGGGGGGGGAGGAYAAAGGYGEPSRGSMQESYSSAAEYDPYAAQDPSVESYDYGHGSGGRGGEAYRGGASASGYEDYGNGDAWGGARGGLKAPTSGGGMGGASRPAPYGSRTSRF